MTKTFIFSMLIIIIGAIQILALVEHRVVSEATWNRLNYVEVVNKAQQTLIGELQQRIGNIELGYGLYEEGVTELNLIERGEE